MKPFDHSKTRLATSCLAQGGHKETGWPRAVAFDHDPTGFAPIGLQAAVPGEACHTTPSHKDTARAWASGHKDVPHGARLGPECATCHRCHGWARWHFDRDEPPPSPLTAPRRALQRPTAKARAPRTFSACHGPNDARDGAFGRAWEKYHTTVSFRQGLARQ